MICVYVFETVFATNHNVHNKELEFSCPTLKATSGPKMTFFGFSSFGRLSVQPNLFHKFDNKFHDGLASSRPCVSSTRCSKSTAVHSMTPVSCTRNWFLSHR